MKIDLVTNSRLDEIVNSNRTPETRILAAEIIEYRKMGSLGCQQLDLEEYKAYTIQIDEECGSDQVWEALAEYAKNHPAPPCLADYVSDGGWIDPRKIGRIEGGAAKAWLARAAKDLNWDERTTPILVTPIS